MSGDLHRLNVMQVPVSYVEIIDGIVYISGRRLKVRMVAEMYARAGASIEQIMAQYNLSASEVHSALAYYYDHEAEFEAEHISAEPLMAEARQKSEARLAAIRSRAERQKPNPDAP